MGLTSSTTRTTLYTFGRVKIYKHEEEKKYAILIRGENQPLLLVGNPIKYHCDNIQISSTVQPVDKESCDYLITSQFAIDDDENSEWNPCSISDVKELAIVKTSADDVDEAIYTACKFIIKQSSFYICYDDNFNEFHTKIGSSYQQVAILKTPQVNVSIKSKYGMLGPFIVNEASKDGIIGNINNVINEQKISRNQILFLTNNFNTFSDLVSNFEDAKLVKPNDDDPNTVKIKNTIYRAPIGATLFKFDGRDICIFGEEHKGVAEWGLSTAIS